MNTLFNSAAHIDLQILEINNATKNFDADFNEMRLQMLARMYAFAKYWAEQSKIDPGPLGKALVERQVPAPEAGQNQFLPIVRILAGRFDHDAPKVDFRSFKNLTKFERNSSWDKYAGVLRYLYEHDVAPEDAVAHIKSFNQGTKKPKLLRGVLEADGDKHAVPRASKPSEVKLTDADKAATIAATKRGPVVVFQDDKGGKARMALAWVYVENGAVFVGGLLPDSEEEATKAAHKSAIAPSTVPATSPEAIAMGQQLGAALGATVVVTQGNQDGEAA